jgi:hypothetical protein
MTSSQPADEFVTDQLREYRARQQQKFEAAQKEDSTAEPGDCKTAEANAPLRVQLDTRCERSRRPSFLSLSDDSSFTGSHENCPGTPREYCERQRQRFAAEKQRRQQEEQNSCTPNTKPNDLDSVDLKSGTALSSTSTVELTTSSPLSSTSGIASPQTPRMRGSSSFRAIAAARAMRMSELPLPGAAWPGHATATQKPIRSQSVGCNPPVLPPRPSSSHSAKSSPGARSQSSPKFPPRPPALANRGSSNCAQSLGRKDGYLRPEVLCSLGRKDGYLRPEVLCC